MKQDIDFIHVHCRGHQDLNHVYYTFCETQQMNRENYFINIPIKY